MAIDDKAIDWLRKQAIRVRRTIENMDRTGYECNLTNFPKGCCHHGSKLLAYHLWESGWTDLKVAKGRRNRKPFQVHIWLLVDGVIVDITADQFGKSHPPVIVKRRSAWHEAWKPEVEVLDRKRLASWRTHEGEAFDAYRAIMAILHREVRP
jgi:hypothetical protein